jgi:hypothetical protein
MRSFASRRAKKGHNHFLLRVHVREILSVEEQILNELGGGGEKKKAMLFIEFLQWNFFFVLSQYEQHEFVSRVVVLFPIRCRLF